MIHAFILFGRHTWTVIAWLVILSSSKCLADTFKPTCKNEERAFSAFVSAASFGGGVDTTFQPTGNLHFVEHQTRDGVTLRGFLAMATDASGAPATPKGTILFVQGDAMLADRMIDQLRDMARAGYDVYIYDFRGYGRSRDGHPSLQGIVSDYSELLAELHSKVSAPDQARSQLFVYALSLGGMFVLNTDALQSSADAVVLDSVPGNVDRHIKLLWLIPIFSIECPTAVQPITHLPNDMSHFLWYQGGADNRVKANAPTQVAALDLARRRGATVILDPQAGHVFMDDPKSTERRVQRALQFFTQVGAEETARVGPGQ